MNDAEQNPGAAPARPSATVMLARDASAAPELFMVRRHAATAFGDSYAFPGGLVDDEDTSVHARCDGISARQANDLLKLTDNALDFFSAALRELFEESGVLLARARNGAWAFQDNSTELAHQREILVSGAGTWAALLHEHDLLLACDCLHYIGHWETPLQLPKRYSARFFVAALPGGQQARHERRELTDGRWIRAAEVLKLMDQDAMKIPFPTMKNLQLMAGHNSLAALLDWARARSASDIRRIRPELIEVDGKRRPVLPDDPDYPAALRS